MVFICKFSVINTFSFLWHPVTQATLKSPIVSEEKREFKFKFSTVLKFYNSTLHHLISQVKFNIFIVKTAAHQVQLESWFLLLKWTRPAQDTVSYFFVCTFIGQKLCSCVCVCVWVTGGGVNFTSCHISQFLFYICFFDWNQTHFPSPGCFWTCT